MMKKIIVLFLLLITTTHFSLADSREIILWQHTATKPGIINKTLIQALQITKKEYGDYKIILSNSMPQERAFRELANSRIDIAHFVSTAEREKQVTPIRIPIMQGLLGYRLCLIKKENQEKFTDINNKQQWLAKNIIIGQHLDWPDTQILKSNGLSVHTTYKQELLFEQLSKKRFDCFARGLSEISAELDRHQDLNLAIEKNLIIHYPFPQFFFVNPRKPLLAERLMLGLTRLQENGEAESLFDNYYREQLNKLAVKQRTYIQLQNPTLSQETIAAIQAPIARFKIKYLQNNQK